MTAEEDGKDVEVQIMVSDKDKQKIQARHAADALPGQSRTYEEISIAEEVRQRLEDKHIQQTQNELNHYRHMIDKLLGSDEENKSAKPRGGELVEIDGDSNPWTSSTASAQNEEAASTAQAHAERNIDQTANYDDEDESSSYEEQYENDFHEILEEVVRHQADLEEDRDDDMDLNESDTTMQSSFIYEERKGVTPSETTQAPNESQTDSVTKKRVANNPTSTDELQNLVDGGTTPDEDDEAGDFDSGRDQSTEERIWQQVIDRHGRQDFNIVYAITDKYVSTISNPIKK